jgi:glycerophosphoryl diester phosphodiesterase
MGSSRSLIIAGATGYGVWPANTLEGARRCLAAPVDGVEIDVQLTADRAVVAHHDYWLSPNSTRLAGKWIAERSAPIKALTLAQARRYDVGRLRPGSDQARRYPDLEGMDGVAIPTLPELLEALTEAEGPRRLIYIEVKTDPSNPEASPAADLITEAAIAAVESADWVSHAKIIAFDWSVLRLAKARAPDLATAHLTIPPSLMGSVKRVENGDSPWADGCDPRHFADSDLAAIAAHGGMEWSPYFTEVTPERVEQAAALGLRVGPWGLSSSADIQRMIVLGVFSTTVSGPAWA